MRSRYVQALVIGAIALGAVVWAWFDRDDFLLPLIIASAGAPGAALLFASGRLDRVPSIAALVGGGTIGVGIAVLGHAIVFAFAYAFFLGFAEEATSLLGRLRLDPRLTSALGSPWTLLLLIEIALVAPLTEEVGKAVGSRLKWWHTDRRSAFLAGVAAGTGFAIVENVFYGLNSGFLGASWEAIIIGRMMGAAVHPLASGLVVMAWWQWRQDGNTGRLIARFFAGVGVHAVWNGSLVVLGVAAAAFDTGTSFSTQTMVSLAYVSALGLVTAAVLWRVTVAVAEDRDRLLTLDSSDGRVVAAWTILAASFIVPMAVLVLAYPDFVGG